MRKIKKLVIIGAGEFAEIVYEYFSFDSEYEVVAFAVEKRYKKADELFELPIIEFESIEKEYPPTQYDVFVAVTYVQLNRIRKRIYDLCKKKGYQCATYISSKSFVWHNVKIGENTFIFENNTVQYNASIGNNVVLWSGNHIGHRTIIEDNCWLTSQVVVSGFCVIGQYSFIGVNATVGDNVVIGRDTVLGAGTVTTKSLMDIGCVYVGNPVRKISRSSYEQFNVKEK
nr:acetyltransferase [uncultured Eisenbergiella sp.]